VNTSVPFYARGSKMGTCYYHDYRLLILLFPSSDTRCHVLSILCIRVSSEIKTLSEFWIDIASRRFSSEISVWYKMIGCTILICRKTFAQYCFRLASGRFVVMFKFSILVPFSCWSLGDSKDRVNASVWRRICPPALDSK